MFKQTDKKMNENRAILLEKIVEFESKCQRDVPWDAFIWLCYNRREGQNMLLRIRLYIESSQQFR